MIQYNDYFPFGLSMTPRSGMAADQGYRYGFQGQEKDDELKGKGNSVNYKYRMHDPRMGRFFAVDPLAAKYPHYSPYGFSGNRLIDAIELEGLEEYLVIRKMNDNQLWTRYYKVPRSQRLPGYESNGTFLVFPAGSVKHDCPKREHYLNSANEGQFRSEGQMSAFDLDNLEALSKTKEMRRNLEKGKSYVSWTFRLNTQFADGSFSLSPEAKKELDMTAKIMMARGNQSFIITGNTSRDGSEEFNNDLANKRARAVLNYLVSAGVNSSQLTTVVNGESEANQEKEVPEERNVTILPDGI